MEESRKSLEEDSPEHMAATLREEAYELIVELESAVLEISDFRLITGFEFPGGRQSNRGVSGIR